MCEVNVLPVLFTAVPGTRLHISYQANATSTSSSTMIDHFDSHY